MAMTDTEAKALARELRDYARGLYGDMSQSRLWSALISAADRIESAQATEARHAAELREQAERFSEALKRYYGINGCPPHPILAPFILPAPDPLVEVFGRENAAEIHAALAARGGKIVWEAGE